ncbi:adenylosuccinate synthase [bacterium]|nr:adenylosuccinate synthase [bacterium]
MDNRVIIGGQWGDEGKGKIVDALSEGIDWVVRYQGGANAGHTIMRGTQKIVLHLVPSGLLSEGVKGYLGNGMVIDPWALRDEVLALEELGIKIRGRLFVSSAAQLLLPYHKRFDEYAESRLKRRSIGTTGRGIGPAYIDKVARRGLRAGDLLQPNENLERTVIEKVLEANESLSALYEAEPLPASSIAQELVVLAKTIGPMVVDGHEALAGVRRGTEKALFEGAQGTLLDIDHGSYPYVTSSNASVGGAVTGTGLPPRCLGEIIGIFKAYCTRVGNGPFPSELLAEEGDDLRRLGGEFGATTGRARRCGWFDLVAGCYAVDLNGMTGVVITKLDVLDSLSAIKVATAYELAGEQQSSFPSRAGALARCAPIYREFPGWQKPTTGCRALKDLPARARQYLEFLEQELGTHIVGVSVGCHREEMIWTPEGVST